MLVITGVPTARSRALAAEICELQDTFDRRAGVSWRIETARVTNKLHAGARFYGAMT